LAVAASLLPVKAHAGFRGSFSYISAGDNLIRGKFSPALRGLPTSGAGTAASPKAERWLAFVTLSSVVGSESVGEIWIYRNSSQAFLAGLEPQPMLRDENGVISYIDPCWSKDGKWLAYVKTDNNVSEASIYVQQYDTSTATLGNVALGSPILIADGTGGVHHRHPAFNSTATRIYYDSDAFGPSIDLWSVDISLDATAHTGTVNGASRVRHQLGLETDLSTQAILNGKAEFKPVLSPDDSQVAFVTNRFGAFQIQLLTPTTSGLGETVVASENNPATVTHDNPSFGTHGTLYYDAPSNEDPANPQDIWRLTLATGAKCNMFVDLAGDTDPNVSQYDNATPDGDFFNLYLFISQAGGFGVQIWQGQSVMNCKPPLPVAVSVSPSQVDLNKPRVDFYTLTTQFPAATLAAGYVDRFANVGGDGVRFRTNLIASPTLMGLAMPPTPFDNAFDCSSMASDLVGAATADDQGHVGCADYVYYYFGAQNSGRWNWIPDPSGGNNHTTQVFWGSRTINDRIVALGLVDKYVGLEYRAYSNRIGQQFLGFGYLKLLRKNTGAGTVVMQQNYPNPFNPVTKINFAVDKPGAVDVRVFNTRGELVRTITNQWYPQGEHTVSWDGKTQSGGHAPSGIYYVRAKSNGSTDVIKAVLAK
jgi:hypothetical protein